MKLYGEMLIPGWVALSVTVLVVVYTLWEGNESKLSCGLFKNQGKTLHETDKPITNCTNCDLGVVPIS